MSKLDWKTRTLLIHRRVVKRWRPFTPEDSRFLALSLCGEVGELANLIKKEWRGDDLSDSNLIEKIREEIADVQIYLHLLAATFNIDIDEAAQEITDNKLKARWPYEYGRE